MTTMHPRMLIEQVRKNGKDCDLPANVIDTAVGFALASVSIEQQKEKMDDLKKQYLSR